MYMYSVISSIRIIMSRVATDCPAWWQSWTTLRPASEVHDHCPQYRELYDWIGDKLTRGSSFPVPVMSQLRKAESTMARMACSLFSPSITALTPPPPLPPPTWPPMWDTAITMVLVDWRMACSMVASSSRLMPDKQHTCTCTNVHQAHIHTNKRVHT